MWHTIKQEEISRRLRVNLSTGLTNEEVIKRREKYGYNRLVEGKKDNILIRFVKQFNDFMIIILIIAAIVSAAMSFAEGTNDYIDSVIIVFIVVLNAILGLIQEYKAEKSLEALKKMSAPTAKVKRNGEIITIPSDELVPGDYIIIETGSYVPADCRLINSYNLKIEESSLTGETVAVNKEAKTSLSENVPVGDMVNMAFGTTIVVNGNGEAIVTNIGMDTKVGKIATMIMADESPETPLQQKLGEVGKKLGLAALRNMLFNIYNRNSKENISIRNVYDINRTCCCSNSRRASCHCYNTTIYRCYKNGKKK